MRLLARKIVCGHREESPPLRSDTAHGRSETTIELQNNELVKQRLLLVGRALFELGVRHNLLIVSKLSKLVLVVAPALSEFHADLIRIGRRNFVPFAVKKSEDQRR
jgi:hypothetical protein